MNQQPRSLAASILSFALTVLVAALALSWAARLVLAVWPVLATVGGIGLVLVIGGRWWLGRSSRW